MAIRSTGRSRRPCVGSFNHVRVPLSADADANTCPTGFGETPLVAPRCCVRPRLYRLLLLRYLSPSSDLIAHRGLRPCARFLLRDELADGNGRLGGVPVTYAKVPLIMFVGFHAMEMQPPLPRRRLMTQHLRPQGPSRISIY